MKFCAATTVTYALVLPISNVIADNLASSTITIPVFNKDPLFNMDGQRDLAATTNCQDIDGNALCITLDYPACIAKWNGKTCSQCNVCQEKGTEYRIGYICENAAGGCSHECVNLYCGKNQCMGCKAPKEKSSSNGGISFDATVTVDISSSGASTGGTTVDTSSVGSTGGITNSGGNSGDSTNSGETIIVDTSSDGTAIVDTSSDGSTNDGVGYEETASIAGSSLGSIDDTTNDSSNFIFESLNDGTTSSALLHDDNEDSAATTVLKIQVTTLLMILLSSLLY